MQITVSGRHVSITPAIKEYARKRVSKLSKYFSAAEKIQVTLNIEGARQWAEVVITPRKGRPLIVAAESDDMYASLDLVTDKAETRLTRYKEKLYGRRSRPKRAPAEVYSSPRGFPSHIVDFGETHMKLLDFVSVDAIVENLKASDKESAITEMAQAVVAAGNLKKDGLKGVVKALLRREELGSTGVGRGIAVPHAKHGSVNSLVGTIALSNEGIDFVALDGEPTHIFFLLLAPTGSSASADYLRALERISAVIRDEKFCRFLRQARSKNDLIDLLKEHDERTQ